MVGRTGINPILKSWSIIKREIYENGKQYLSKYDFLEGIKTNVKNRNNKKSYQNQ